MTKPPKAITVPCSHCKGCGRIELTGEYAATLSRMKIDKREVTAAELAVTFNIQPTAMSNRLARLEGMGFLTSRRFGKKRLFRAKKVTS